MTATGWLFTIANLPQSNGDWHITPAELLRDLQGLAGLDELIGFDQRIEQLFNIVATIS